MPGNERFNDDDVRRIIAEAARVEDESKGITYDELKEIASSVGVSEHSIAQVLSAEAPKVSRLRRIGLFANWAFYGAACLVSSLVLPLPEFSTLPGGDGLLIFAALAALAAGRRHYKGFSFRAGALFFGHFAMAMYGNRADLANVLWGKVGTMYATTLAISCLVGALVIMTRGSRNTGSLEVPRETLRARVGRKLKSWIDIVFHRTTESRPAYDANVS